MRGCSQTCRTECIRDPVNICYLSTANGRSRRSPSPASPPGGQSALLGNQHRTQPRHAMHRLRCPQPESNVVRPLPRLVASREGTTCYPVISMGLRERRTTDPKSINPELNSIRHEIVRAGRNCRMTVPPARIKSIQRGNRRVGQCNATRTRNACVEPSIRHQPNRAATERRSRAQGPPGRSRHRHGRPLPPHPAHSKH